MVALTRSATSQISARSRRVQRRANKTTKHADQVLLKPLPMGRLKAAFFGLDQDKGDLMMSIEVSKLKRRLRKYLAEVSTAKRLKSLLASTTTSTSTAATQQRCAIRRQIFDHAHKLWCLLTESVSNHDHESRQWLFDLSCILSATDPDARFPVQHYDLIVSTDNIDEVDVHGRRILAIYHVMKRFAAAGPQDSSEIKNFAVQYWSLRYWNEVELSDILTDEYVRQEQNDRRFSPTKLKLLEDISFAMDEISDQMHRFLREQNR